jgi:magnesium-transporting ATPase (P-type)
MNCKNCDAPVEGAFCSHCGQKAEIHRVSIGYLIHELFHAITHADKGFLLLIKDLVTKPGIVAREYLDGKRKKYFNPLSFLVITAALSAYVTHATGYSEHLTHADAQPNKHVPYWEETMSIVVDHSKLLGLVLIVPVLSILAWALFRKPRYNLSEVFVLQAYVMGQCFILRTVISVPAFLIAPDTMDLNNMLFQTIFLVYMIVANKQFFSNNLFFTILKSILIMFLFIVLYWVLIWGFVFLKHTIVGP